MQTLLQDLRFAFRQLLKNPGFTFVAVLTLALGIGANTAVFSVVHGVLLRPLPYREADRLVMLWERNPQLGFDEEQPAPASVVEWRTHSRVLEEVGYLANDTPSTRNFLLEIGGEAHRVRGRFVSSGFVRVLGVDPMLGRAFTVAEDERNATCVAILSHSFWQNHFGANRDVLGQKLKIGGIRSGASTVIGVMPPEFRFPRDADVWLSLSGHPFHHPQRYIHDLWVVARLKPGVTLEQARVELNSIQARLQQAHPEVVHLGSQVKVVPLLDQLIGPQTRPALMVLIGAVGFVLLIACANVANLLLTRATARQREIAIRTALGASRARVFLQLLTESLLLAIVGGGAGVLLAWAGMEALPALDSARSGGVKEFRIPRFGEVNMDNVVLGYSLLVTVCSSVVFGMFPALQSLKLDVITAIKEQGQGVGAAMKTRRTRSVLLVSEIALSLILLTGTALMLQSLLNTLRIDPGIRPENVLLAEVDLDLARRAYSGNRQEITFQLLERARVLPGVRAAGAIGELPLHRSGMQMVLLIEGQPETAPTKLPMIDERVVTPGFFETLGMPLRTGRAFTENDTLQSPLVAVINETAARRFFPNQNAIGQRILPGHPAFPLRRDQMREIVGIIGDVRDYSLSSEARPEVYTSYRQRATNNWGGSEYVLPTVFRTTQEPASIIPTLRAAIEGSSPGRPLVGRFQLMQQVLSQSADEQRFRTVLMGAFGACALVLALVGIYGVFSNFVALRTNEIGLRLALGAQRNDVLRLVLGHALKLICIGVAIGGAGSLALNHALASQLLNVSPTDLVTLVGVSIVLTGFALAACFIPARRAANIDPMTALRHE